METGHFGTKIIIGEYFESIGFCHQVDQVKFANTDQVIEQVFALLNGVSGRVRRKYG